MTDYTDLIARLHDVSTEKQQEAWGRVDGGLDLSIGAMLADEAAAAIAALTAERDALRDALQSIEHLTDNERIRGIARAALTAPTTAR